VGGIDQSLADVKRFARRRPGMFLAGAMGAGFLMGRLLRSTDMHSVMDAAKHANNQDGDGTMASQDGDGAMTPMMTPPLVTGELGSGAAFGGVDLTEEMP